MSGRLWAHDRELRVRESQDRLRECMAGWTVSRRTVRVKQSRRGPTLSTRAGRRHHFVLRYAVPHPVPYGKYRKLTLMLLARHARPRSKCTLTQHRPRKNAATVDLRETQ